MKKNVIQKMFAAVLVGAMAMGTLAGCGSDAGTSSGSETEGSSAASSQPAEGSSEASSSEAEVAGIDGFVPFEEKVTLNIPVYQRATPNGAADAGDNYWTQWIQTNFGDKYNIEVNFKDWVIPRGEENSMYAQWASVQKLPTVCFEYDYPDLTLYQIGIVILEERGLSAGV